MTRVQVLILAGLAIMVLVVFCVAAVLVQSVLLSPTPPDAVAEPPTMTPLPSDTPTLIFASTATPTPNVPRSPTATNTRVVLDTLTPTPSATPTITPTPTDTATPTRVLRGGGGGSAPATRPTPASTSRYPLKILDGPLSYETHNNFLVILAQVTSGYTYLPGYRLIAIRTPSGAVYKGPPSCNRICKANGPEGTIIQRGNMVLETPYERGTWSVMVVDPQGQQTSDIFQIDLAIEDRWWFYYRFGR